MRISIHFCEITVGALLFGIGLLYLTTHFQTLEKLTEAVKREILVEGDLYQQYTDVLLNQVSEEELYALVMGYREYPIVIEDTVIYPENMETEVYFPLIKDGLYKKEYVYDINHNITKIVFTYIVM